MYNHKIKISYLVHAFKYEMYNHKIKTSFLDCALNILYPQKSVSNTKQCKK